MEIHELTELVEEQRSVMISVAVHETQIGEAESEYKARRKAIARELRRLGLEDPNRFAGLWDWYAYWKDNLPTYVSRRQYVNALFQELLDALDHLTDRQLGSGLHEAVTGWPRVDGQLAQLRERYARARTEEDNQAIGLLCRDIVLSLGDACYVHEHHGGGRGKEPTTPIERLEKVAATNAAGASNKQLRQLLKSTLEFANHVQHDRAATLDDAAVSAEVTVALVSLFRVVTVGAAPITADERVLEDATAEAAEVLDDDIPF